MKRKIKESHILTIAGFVLILTSGSDANVNASIIGTILQFLMGLALFFPGYIKFIRGATENENN